MTVPTASPPQVDEPRIVAIVRGVLDSFGLAVLAGRVAELFKTKTCHGVINTTGPNGSVVQAGSGDWTLTTRTGTGDVTVTFDPAFSVAPSVTATLVDTTNFRTVKLKATVTTTTARFECFSPAAAIATDNVFHFHAIGDR